MRVFKAPRILIIRYHLLVESVESVFGVEKCLELLTMPLHRFSATTRPSQ